MRVRAISCLIFSLTMMLLVNCGGGGSGSNPGALENVDQASAQSSGLKATFSPDIGIVQMAWKDTFPSALSYRLESQAADASWTELDGIPGNHGDGSILTLQRVVASDTTFRVQAVLPTHSVPLQTTEGETTIRVVLPKSTEPLMILLGQSEPVSGTVQLTVSGAPSALSVEWYADLQSIGNSTFAPNFTALWDTGSLTTGTHLVIARVQTSPGSYIELRRTVEVNTPTVTVKVGITGMTIRDDSPYSPIYYAGADAVYVIGTSAYGIQSISASLDGQSLGTLTAPNGCLFFGPYLWGVVPAEIIECNGPAVHYLFPIDTATYRSGIYILTASATDGNGQTATITQTVSFANTPALALTSPSDGQLVYGTLAVAGTVTSDKPGPVTTTATLGSVPILNSQEASFSTTYDLTGIPAGSYTLTVKSTDSGSQIQQWTTIQRTITVVSSPNMVQTPLFTIGSTGEFLAAEGTKVLYRAADNSVRLRDVSGSEIILQESAKFLFADTWQVSNGNVFVKAKGQDCTMMLNCIYWWKSDGTITNLSSSITSSRDFDMQPVAHFPYVVWTNFWLGQDLPLISTYTVYNVQTGTYQTVEQPVGVTDRLDSPSFYIMDGAVNLYFSVREENSSVYYWDSRSGQSVILASRGGIPKTDGRRVAWHEGPSLVVQPVPFGSVQTISSTAQNFILRDGILAWIESSLNAYAIKAATVTSTYTLSSVSTSNLLGVGGGDVVYIQSGKLYAWNPAIGSHLLLDTAPGFVIITGKTLYWTNGVSQAVYSFALP